MAERDDFLGRWSRRKGEARQGLRKKAPPRGPRGAEEPDAGVAERPVETPPAAEPRSEQAALRVPDEAGELQAGSTPEEAPEIDPAEFENIDFDKLGYGDDYTRFMQKGVPEAIRRRALRALWQSDPILANVDGLNDYDEDFTDAALAVKTLVSSWNPGKGYMTDEERLASYVEGSDPPDQVEDVEPAEDVEADAEAVAAAETEDGAPPEDDAGPDDVGEKVETAETDTDQGDPAKKSDET